MLSPFSILTDNDVFCVNANWVQKCIVSAVISCGLALMALMVHSAGVLFYIFYMYFCCTMYINSASYQWMSV